MKRFRKIIRMIFFANLLFLALAGVPVMGCFYERKRDDLFDNEIKIERVEEKTKETALPYMNELR